MFVVTLCRLVANALRLAKHNVGGWFESEVIIKRLVCWLTGYSVEQFYQHWNNVITFNVQHFWQKYEQALLGRPLAYLTNQVKLGTIQLWADERVLIPRPETYDLAMSLIVKIKRNFADYCRLSMLEIGTGSGLISILLAKAFPESQIIATDINQQAITVARSNLALHQVMNVKLLVGNFLEPVVKLNIKFDVVVCNPPYLTVNEFRQRLALHYEPESALVADGGDGTTYYQQIQSLPSLLKTHFIGLMEMSPTQKKKIKMIFQNNFAHLSFAQDWQAQDRYVYFHSSPFAIN